MAETRRLNALTSDTLQRLDLLHDSGTVALSGGADSAALAYLALRAGARVDAVHIHHGLPASDVLAAAADGVAAELGVELETVSVEVGTGPSPEAQARQARYEVIDNWSRPIFTAHTRDDNAETILMNLVRGSGVGGMAGIPRHRPPVTWRPMLDITRDETREIATLAGLAFADDPMNNDPELTRTRFRHNVLPLLREINPRLDEALARAAVSVDADSSLLDSLAPRVTGPVPASLLQTIPRPIADRVLMKMLAEADIGPTEDRIRRMWSVVSEESDRQDLADGMSVVRRGAIVEIQ